MDCCVGWGRSRKKAGHPVDLLVEKRKSRVAWVEFHPRLIPNRTCSLPSRRRGRRHVHDPLTAPGHRNSECRKTESPLRPAGRATETRKRNSPSKKPVPAASFPCRPRHSHEQRLWEATGIEVRPTIAALCLLLHGSHIWKDRGRDGALSCTAPPSEPDWQISRIRLSGQQFAPLWRLESSQVWASTRLKRPICLK
jgi:hypothetical protein